MTPPDPEPEPRVRSERAERTRAAVYDAAMSLFEERGYDATTMRVIAERAGVSLGSSYTYFPSKEHLILEFYRRLVHAQAEAAAGVLAGSRDLEERISGTLRALIEVVEQVRRTAGSIAASVADPGSPANPFGPASAPLRAEAIAMWRSVVDGSDARLPAEIRAELPELLWVGQMGLLYLWQTDRSAGREATLETIREGVPLFVQMLSLAGLPMLRDTRAHALRLTRSILSQLAPP